MTKSTKFYHQNGVVATKDHFPHKPRAVTMELWEPKRKWLKAVPNTPPKSCSVVTDPQVWSHMWPRPQPHAILMDFYSHGSSHMIKENESTVLGVRGAMISQLCVYSKRWFMKIVQVIMKHNPFDAMHDAM